MNKENMAILTLLESIGSSVTAMIKQNKLIEQPIEHNNSVFEDVFMSRLKERIILEIGVKKPEGDR